MTAPYKIAVAAAATLLLVVIASLLLEKDPQPAGIGSTGPAAIADGRPAPEPPPGAFAPAPTAAPAPPAKPVPALPFGDPTQPSAGAAAPPVDPARIEYLDPVAAADAPRAETFDVGRTAFDKDGRSRPSLFDPQPDATAPRPDPGPATAAAAAPRPGVLLGPGDLIAPPAEPNAPASVSPGSAASSSAASSSAPAAPPLTYTIKSGDSLSSVALELYGSGNHWIEIAQANPLVDPDRLKVGQVIKLPGPPGTTPTIPPAVTPDRAPPPDLGGGTQYTVKENDTLSGIAKQFYNAASKWQFIYEANRAAIGSDPGRMKPGTVLVIPPPDSGAR